MPKRGRPGFSATPELRKKVSDLISAQIEKKEIAAALKISLPTLRKHFADLLEAGAETPGSGRRAKGRPRFKPTAKQRRQCEGYAAFGMSREDIARVFGITPPTVDEHFAEELKTGWAKLRAEQIDRLREHSKTNAGAAARILEKIGAVGAEDRIVNQPSPDPPQPAVTTRIGKKAQAAAEATTAGEGSDWGDDLRVPGAPLN